MKGDDGLVNVSVGPQGIAEVAVGFGVVGLEIYCLTVCGDGLAELSAVFQRTTEVAVGFGVVGNDIDGLFDQIHRNIIPAHLKRDHSEQVQGIRVLWLLRENLPVKRLRLRQPPGLMVGNGGLKGLFDGERGHSRKVCEMEPEATWNAVTVP